MLKDIHLPDTPVNVKYVEKKKHILSRRNLRNIITYILDVYFSCTNTEYSLYFSWIILITIFHAVSIRQQPRVGIMQIAKHMSVRCFRVCTVSSI